MLPILLVFSVELCLPQVFGGIRAAHIVSFLCCVVLFCIVCLRHVSCVPNVACVVGLPTLDCQFMITIRFSLTFIYKD